MRWIGLDVHHRYIHVTELSDDGCLKHDRLAVNPAGLAELKGRLGSDACVVMEATTSSARLYDELKPYAKSVVVSHPAQTRGASALHVKTDMRDGEILARLLASDFVRPVWVPPSSCRALRTLIEYRNTLTRQHTACVNQIYACFRSELMEYPAGLSRRKMDVAATVDWGDTHTALMVQSVLELKKCVHEQLRIIDRALEAWCASSPEAGLLRSVPGLGAVLTAAILTEVGDVQRFKTAGQLCAYAGLVPKVHVSGTIRCIGHLAKGGRHRLRWALYMATLHLVHADAHFKGVYSRLCSRRPKKVALIACARKLLVVIWHMLRRGQPFRS